MKESTKNLIYNTEGDCKTFISDFRQNIFCIADTIKNYVFKFISS